MAQFVGGRYQLIAQLGGGGMADVYLAKMIGKSDFAKLAVVKRLKMHDAEDSEVAKMFADEARLSARLNHPNIVQTFEVGEDTEGPYLVMEYLEGQPLSRLRSRSRRRGTPLPRTIGLHVLKEALTALSYAHQLCDHDGEPLCVVHRDVSPENVLVTYAGTTKLVDFGVAKTANSSTRTRAGVLKGKIAYMAPEQARSDTSLDARADVFAAGLILWEILAGKRMWEGMTELDVVARLVDPEPLPSLRSVDPDIPEELDRVCIKALSKEREARYSSAGEMLEELEKIQRKLDLHSTAREVSQLVTSLFEDEREKMKKVVSAAVTRATGPAGEGDASLPRLANRTSTTSDLVGPESDASVWSSINGAGPIPTPSTPQVAPLSSKSNATEISTPATTTPSVPVGEPAPKGGKGKPVIAALIVAAAIGIGFKVYTSSDQRPPPEPVQAKQSPAPPPATDTAPPPTVATNATPPPAPEVTVDITAKPAAARIFVDGKRAPGNPHRITAARGDATHEIRAEADGFEPRSVTVAFDRDRALDLTLVGKGVTAPPVVMGAPAKPVAHAPKPSAPPSPATTAAPPPTTAAAPPAPTPTSRGISEIDPTKSSTQPKQDTIDKDVFKR